jgi:chorismate-pyruvate lyase
MTSSSSQALGRDLFADPSASAADAGHAQHVLALLLAQDGSTTRLCEAIAASPLTLQVLRQAVTTDVPQVVRDSLPGTHFIERITCLAAHGQVMMDNLAYIALDGFAPDLRNELESGVVPIGHLLSRLWVRRAPLNDVQELQQRLWNSVGQPDPAATRSYTITTPEGPRMVIAETYRRGMLMKHGKPATAA